MFHHLHTNRWDLHINQPRGESCIKHVCCISRMNFYRSDFKHKIYGLYTGKYGMYRYFKRVAMFRDKHYRDRSVCDALRICYFDITIS